MAFAASVCAAACVSLRLPLQLLALLSTWPVWNLCAVENRGGNGRKSVDLEEGPTLTTLPPEMIELSDTRQRRRQGRQERAGKPRDPRHDAPSARLPYPHQLTHQALGKSKRGAAYYRWVELRYRGLGWVGWQWHWKHGCMDGHQAVSTPTTNVHGGRDTFKRKRYTQESLTSSTRWIASSLEGGLMDMPVLPEGNRDTFIKLYRQARTLHQAHTLHYYEDIELIALVAPAITHAATSLASACPPCQPREPPL